MSQDAECAIGVDVGGTRTSVALVSQAGIILSLRRESTPREAGAEATLPLISQLIRDTLAETGARPVGIGVGFGGPVDYVAQRVRRSNHAPGWSDAEPALRLGEEFGLPAWLENDANAGGLAEVLYGAARGAADALYVNVGTGVGGAVILGGRVHHGAHSNAGEFGHMVIDPLGPPCPCGRRGCVEALCSGDAIGRMARESWAGEGAAPSGRGVGEMAMAGDEWALGIVARAAAEMGRAISIACNLLNPDVVVLGGGVPEMGEVYLAPVRESFSRHAMDCIARSTPILGACLGYDAGVIGAAAVAMQASSQ